MSTVIPFRRKPREATLSMRWDEKGKLTFWLDEKQLKLAHFEKLVKALGEAAADWRDGWL